MSYQEKFSKTEKEFAEEVAKIDRVTRVVKGGRRFRFRAIVVIGNRKGKVGFGVAKGSDVSEAIKKANRKARKNLRQVSLEGSSIAHQVEGKFKASYVLLKPAREGTGVIAGGGVRIVMDLLGVQDVLAKIFGSSNKLNSIRATLIALDKLRSPKLIAAMRGKKWNFPPAQDSQKKTKQTNQK